jgi:DNA-binding MarR family transcriptional regulator
MVDLCQLFRFINRTVYSGVVTEHDPQMADTWARLMGLFFSRRDALFAELARLQLTPPHGHALMTLLHGGPARMRDMAEHMACDASYITAVADRLEELGLAERRSTAEDRRVKELALTAKGEKVAARLHAVVADPPETLHSLSDADREALARIVRTLGEPSSDAWLPQRNLR